MYDDVRTLLSLARTALADPAGLPGETRLQHFLDWDSYAIERIDEVLAALDVEDAPAVALRTLGRLIADVADSLDDYGVGGDGEPFDTRELAAELRRALDIVDGVIAALSADDVEVVR